MIYDLDGNPIYSQAMVIPAAGAPVLQIAVDCLSGFVLLADNVANLLVQARKLGDTPWTNIETTPISLTAEAGNRVTFEVRITADNLTSKVRRNFALRVKKP